MAKWSLEVFRNAMARSGFDTLRTAKAAN